MFDYISKEKDERVILLNIKRQIFLLVFGFLLMTTLIGGVLFLWQSETQEMEDQEIAGSLMADEYLLSISEGTFTTITEDPTSNIDEFDYEDNEIFGSYSEDKAVGKLDCVLEIPAIELRQSVFTGTPQQIKTNLNRWLAVTGRSDYILGSTHYCVYMHNPTNKSIRISYAQETLVPGDYIVVTQEDTVFFYEMTRMFPEWRQTCTKAYTDNMALDSSWLYIFTCARREWQGRNLVIEGKLYNTYSLEDWTQNKDTYIAEYEGQYDRKDVSDMLLNMNITNEGNQLKVSVRRPDNTHALHCSVGLFDNEGYVVGDEYAYTGEPLYLDLPTGEYIIGISTNNTEFGTPMPYKINLAKHTVEIATVDKVEEEIESEGTSMMYAAMTVLILFGIMYLFMVIKTIRAIVKHKQNSKILDSEI